MTVRRADAGDARAIHAGLGDPSRDGLWVVAVAADAATEGSGAAGAARARVSGY